MSNRAPTTSDEDPILVKARDLKARTIEQTGALRQAYEAGFPNSAPIAQPSKELNALRHLTKTAGFKLHGV
jgi:hypothetical protein